MAIVNSPADVDTMWFDIFNINVWGKVELKVSRTRGREIIPSFWSWEDGSRLKLNLINNSFHTSFLTFNLWELEQGGGEKLYFSLGHPLSEISKAFGDQKSEERKTSDSEWYTDNTERYICKRLLTFYHQQLKKPNRFKYVFINRSLKCRMHMFLVKSKWSIF